VLRDLTFRYLTITRYATTLREPVSARYYKYSVAYSRHDGVDTWCVTERFLCLRQFPQASAGIFIMPQNYMKMFQFTSFQSIVYNHYLPTSVSE
jgi:hypothetical protein